MTPQPTPARTHIWDGTHHIPDWLGPDQHHWTGSRLAIRTTDGDSHPRPGWWLIGWTDGAVTVASPRIGEREYGPDGPWARAERAETELLRYAENESADAAAGSYALRAEGVEAQLARVTALYERWVKAGPPLGVSLARWWDARLVELREVIRPPVEVSGPAATEATERPTLRERHRSRWLALTDAERAARIAALDDDDEPEQPARTTPDNPPTSSDEADNALAERIRTLIESEMYEYRERAMFWPEGGVTTEIARLATRGALEALGRPAPAPRDEPADADDETGAWTPDPPIGCLTVTAEPPAPRDPCPHCESSSDRVPRALLAEHVATVHPEQHR